MKKLNLAIIGQGRSGKDIHGVYYRSANNKYYNVKYVVDMDEKSRERAEQLYPGCKTFASYQELFGLKDIDIVVNASYSHMHYAITKDLLEHKFNVMVEKPFSRTRYECDTLINTAKENGVVLAVFQQTFYAPYYLDILRRMKEQQFGKVEQISIRYNGLKRRWDWQTLQKKVGGDVYNTGPHPIGIGLGFLDFDENTKVLYSKLDCTSMTSGDADNYAKILFSAPGKPLIDLEITATDAFNEYAVKMQCEFGTYKTNNKKYQCKYVDLKENTPRSLVEGTLRNEEGLPIYCSDNLIYHDEEGVYDGTAFDAGTAGIYEDLYYKLTEGREMFVTAEHAAKIISIIEQVHAENPLPLKY